MIETKEAVNNLDSILSVEELDAVYVGPSDLAISLGYKPMQEEKEVEDTITFILESCKNIMLKQVYIVQMERCLKKDLKWVII